MEKKGKKGKLYTVARRENVNGTRGMGDVRQKDGRAVLRDLKHTLPLTPSPNPLPLSPPVWPPEGLCSLNGRSECCREGGEATRSKPGLSQCKAGMGSSLGAGVKHLMISASHQAAGTSAESGR